MTPTREEIKKVINNTRGVAGYLYSSGIEAIISALLSNFDITEKGKIAKLEKVVEAAREVYKEGFDLSNTESTQDSVLFVGEVLREALAELDGKEEKARNTFNPDYLSTPEKREKILQEQIKELRKLIKDLFAKRNRVTIIPLPDTLVEHAEKRAKEELDRKEEEEFWDH